MPVAERVPAVPAYPRFSAAGTNQFSCIRPGQYGFPVFIRRKDPKLGEKYQSYPPTYLRNIEKGKTKKKSWCQYVFLEVALKSVNQAEWAPRNRDKSARLL